VDDAIVIRRLTEADRDAVSRLAQLDTRPAPSGDLLGAENEGRLVAAISITTGESVADPFQPTAEVVEMLRIHLAHLRRRERRIRSGWSPHVPAPRTR
jgi:hypothetical protein